MSGMFGQSFTAGSQPALVPYRLFSGLKNKKMLRVSQVLCHLGKGSDEKTYAEL